MTEDKQKAAALARVERLALRSRAKTADLAEAEKRRDEAIKTAAAKATVREIAVVSGLSRSRVDQIVRGV